MARLASQQLWSERVEKLLAKRIKKCLEMNSMPLGVHGEHEVKVNDERVVYKERDGNFTYKKETFRYKVIISNGNIAQCACLNHDFWYRITLCIGAKTTRHIRESFVLNKDNTKLG
jgi:hypothetical protein